MAKRLIDADKFLQRVVKRFKCVPLVGSCDNDSESMSLLLAQAPTVDAVEVVFCKDCEWRDAEGDCTNPKCGKSWYGCPVPDEHYCSYGERKEG